MSRSCIIALLIFFVSASGFSQHESVPCQFAATPAVKSGDIYSLRQSLAVGDLDGDSNLDSVSAHADGLNLFLNKGNGTFVASLPIETGHKIVATGDFDGDGDLDLAITDAQLTFNSVVDNASWGIRNTLPINCRIRKIYTRDYHTFRVSLIAERFEPSETIAASS